MSPFAYSVLLLITRYLHIVCTTLLVGGTLFYEMVVPVAIDELTHEQQLLVFARARWVFKSIVWSCAVVLLASGVFQTRHHWKQYSQDNYTTIVSSPDPGRIAPQLVASDKEIPPASRPGWWWVAHASSGMVAIGIALSLATGPTPPARPIAWMRLNLVILLLVIFLGSVTRHARLNAAGVLVPPEAPTADAH